MNADQQKMEKTTKNLKKMKHFCLKNNWPIKLKLEPSH